MTDIIHLLPDAVANQIAAGEVIQRPASVVKELVENSIDAGATRVQVLITDAGRTCIQVIDNGKGMSETDARLSFERHATSKISKADDLFALRTMGFRGEALASIAAIAEVELRTRRPSDELGISIVVEGSRIRSQEPISCPAGANFAVRNLFYNVPARRKFLKTNHTELANIVAEFERITIAHPDVEFTLVSNEQQLLQLPAGNFHQRVTALFGKRIDSKLLPVQTETELVKISGFVGTPESARKKSAQQFFITNSRYMRHNYFAKAIHTAFDRLIPDGFMVPFFLQLEVDPAQIDVNVHPTKTEIKFTDEAEIWQIILVAVREALGRHNAIPSLDFTQADRPEIPTFQTTATPGESVAPPKLHINTDYNPFHATSSPAHTSSSTPKTTLLPEFELPELEAVDQTHPSLFADAPIETTTPGDSSFQTYLQFRGQYILAPSEHGLQLIDQHRASHRILYDQYRKRMADNRCATQGLLFPQLIQLSPTLASVAETLSEDLANLGFNISNLGGGSYSILGMPVGTEGLDPISLLQTILDDTQATVLDNAKMHQTAAESIHHMIANSLARRAAIPVGESLTTEDMQNLCAELMATTLPTYTPDGKPIIITLSPDQITRMFA